MSDGRPLAYRVDVIQPDVVRLRWNLGETSERLSDMLATATLPCANFELAEANAAVALTTSRLRLECPRQWQISAYDDPRPQRGSLFFSERTNDRAYGPGFEVAPSGYDCSPDGSLTARMSLAVRPGESFYGLGEKFTSLDKWGHEHTLWAMDSGNVTSYRSYKNIPLLLSSQGYGLFVHSSYPMVFKLGNESSITTSIHLAEPRFDAFLIYGPQVKHILARYTELTGRAPIPPQWSFGFWISRAGYHSRGEVETVVREMRSRGFPCDVLNIDPWWQGNGPWCSYDWDTQAFPNPQEMIAGLREQGIRICLWVTPYLPAGTPRYAEAVERGYLILAPDGSPAPVMEAFSGERLGAVDFTNPAACAWWQGLLARLMEMGVAVFKTDFGEQAPVEAIYADRRSGIEMHNLYPLLYNRAAFEVSRARNGSGLVWGRAAYAGSQRYPVQWGGDSYAALDQLAGQLRGLLSYGLSGVPFCSHDVGGFDYSPHFFDNTRHVNFQESYDPALQVQYPKDPVVHARWLQVGVFSSHMRAHGKQAREPWTYGPEIEGIAHRYLDLRYRLLPHLYTQAAHSSRSGLPMVRPLVLDFQEDPTTQRLDTQYLFGESFLVAPPLSPDHVVQVYLPRGQWVDFWTKETLNGRRWLKLTAAMDTLPLWVRGGSILPLGPSQDYVDQKPLDPLTLEIYDPRSHGEIVVEDEDRPGIPARYTQRGKNLLVAVGPTPGALEIIVYGIRAVSACCQDTLLPIEILRSPDGTRVLGVKISLDGRSGVEVAFKLA